MVYGWVGVFGLWGWWCDGSTRDRSQRSPAYMKVRIRWGARDYRIWIGWRFGLVGWWCDGSTRHGTQRYLTYMKVKMRWRVIGEED